MPADPTLEQLRGLEERLLRSDTRKCAAEVAALLADEFVEFGSSGRVFNKQQTLEALQTEAPLQRALTDFHAVWLASGVALATYRVVVTGAPGEPPRRSLRSSIWRCAAGAWQMLFHQGTPSSEA